MTGVKAVAGALEQGHHEAAHLRDIALLGLRRTELSPVRFVIFGRGRTGSTMLVDLLGGLPGVHCDGEILRRPTLFPRAYVRACAARPGQAVYGCKILSYQVQQLQPLRRPERFLGHLAADGFKVIHISRTNVVAHAISNLRAREYGFHQQGSSSATTASKMVVDPAELLTWIHRSESLGTFETTSLAGLPHLALNYESDLVSDALHGDTLRRVADFLGLATDALPAIASSYRKVSPVALSDSIDNYAEVARHLAGTPYARFLS